VRGPFSVVGLFPSLTLRCVLGDPSAASASNLADWHDACLHSLAIPTQRSESMWLCEEDAPFIYLTAITLNGDAEKQRSLIARIAAQDARPLSVCDCWSHLDLSDLGFERFESEAWYVRERDEVPQAVEEVERVLSPASLAEFESASTDGFGSIELHELGPFGVYGTGVLDDPRIRIFVRRVHGKVVSGSMGCISAGVIGVYAVATIPGFRRRGYGEQVTWAATASAPSLPAVLQPSHEGLGMYRRMGFVPVGSYTKWLRLP
jgi:hypothetical protein